MTHQRPVSSGEYSQEVLGSLLHEHQVKGVPFTGISLRNHASDLADPIAAGGLETLAQPLEADSVQTLFYWGQSGHPVSGNALEVMRDSTQSPTDWRKIRRDILGSTIGDLIYDKTSLEPGVRPGGIAGQPSYEELEAMCTDLGLPVSVYQSAGVLGLGRAEAKPNIAILWHPSLVASEVALSGLRSAVEQYV